MNAVKTTLAVLVALGLVVLIVVGGWLGGWWLNGANTDRQAKIDQQNYGSQLAYITRVSTGIADIAAVHAQAANPGLSADQRTALTNQETALVQVTCGIEHLITTPDASISAWVSTHC